MSKEIEKVADLIPENMEMLKSYLKEYNNAAKPLGEKSQEKIRKFMHKLYGKYNSWVADKIVRWEEENIALDRVAEEFQGATTHFGPQSKKAVDEAIENANNSFIAKGDYGKLPNLQKTFYVCADNVLNRNKQSLLELSGKLQSPKQEQMVNAR